MQNYSILLVDDEELIRKTIGTDLKEEGYNITEAENGKIAIELLQNNLSKQNNNSSSTTEKEIQNQIPFDLVITDLAMEEVGGLDVLKAAKKTNPDCMVIILTGYGNLTSAIEALRFKADDYLLKPCDGEELHFRVKRCLQNLEFQRKIKIYENMLPVCCVCKSIRDDSGREHGTGHWIPMEMYISNKTNLEVSHTFCPRCNKEFMERAIKERNESSL